MTYKLVRGSNSTFPFPIVKQKEVRKNLELSSGCIFGYHIKQYFKVTTAMMMALPYGTKRIMSSYFFADSDAGPPSGQPSTSDGESGECTNGWVCEHRL